MGIAIRAGTFLLALLSLGGSAEADQPYWLVQVSCYPEAKFLEVRFFGTQNLDLWGVARSGNLINLEAAARAGSAVGVDCAYTTSVRGENRDVAIRVIVEPFGNSLAPGQCYFFNAFLSAEAVAVQGGMERSTRFVDRVPVDTEVSCNTDAQVPYREFLLQMFLSKKADYLKIGPTGDEKTFFDVPDPIGQSDVWGKVIVSREDLERLEYAPSDQK